MFGFQHIIYHHPTQSKVNKNTMVYIVQSTIFLFLFLFLPSIQTDIIHTHTLSLS
jgi:hypothetical protein